ncbi:hypothetical protein OfM1_11360 [Lactovum odontotermitis]
MQGVPFDVVVTKPRYQEDFYKMLEAENQKINGVIPDDSAPVSRAERQRWREDYE